jgi:hypothetical protein
MVASGMEIEYTLAPSLPSTFLNKMQTTYPLKIQVMRSKGKQPRFYVSFPLALAAAIGLEGGETVQWELLDRSELHLLRPHTPPPLTKRRAPQNRAPEPS